MPDVQLPGTSESKVDAGDIFAASSGNEFLSVGLVFDLTYAVNTRISGTAAIGFDVGVRSNTHTPVLWDTLGAPNYFADSLAQGGGRAYIEVTEDLGTNTLVADGCYWGGRTTSDLETNSPDLFLEDGSGLPNNISIDNAQLSLPYIFPWDYWSALKAGTYSSPANPEELRVQSIESWPNPSMSTATLFIRGLEGATKADMDIYDISGRHIRTLRAHSSEGRLVADWDGKTADGQRVGAGVYFIRVRVGDDVYTSRLVRLR